MNNRMNERLSLQAELKDLTGQFRVDRILYAYDEQAQYEPTAQIPVIHTIGHERCLSDQRWGLMPYWGKNSIRADRDSLDRKPYLMGMLTRKRCVVPCSGLYFDHTDGKNTITYQRKHASKQVFGAAGIYDVWLDSEKNEYPMCTMIFTSRASREDGVPLVLEGEALDEWLAPERRTAESLCWLLRSIPEPEFYTEPVDSLLYS